MEADREKRGKKPLPAEKKQPENAAAGKNTKVSTTDPESGFMHREGKPKGYFWLDQRTVDPTKKRGLVSSLNQLSRWLLYSCPNAERIARLDAPGFTKKYQKPG